jgi:transcriptional regulator with XRE-family HTH domain
MINNQERGHSVKNIAINLYQLRQARNMTHEQLAELMEVSVRSVYFWEDGSKIPSLDKLIELAYTFNTSVDSILRNS